MISPLNLFYLDRLFNHLNKFEYLQEVVFSVHGNDKIIGKGTIDSCIARPTFGWVIKLTSDVPELDKKKGELINLSNSEVKSVI